MYKIELQDKNNNTIYPYSTGRTNFLVDKTDNVSTTISPVDRNKATVEIERGEYVFDPSKLTLHKALGNKHNKGGTPVNLVPDTFIFSDYKNMGITKPEKELFEFKLGGTNKPKNNTPAKLIDKEVDVNHHNRMVNILNNKHQDDIAKNSAMLMLQKNIEKLGKIAYLQENKKGFPQGVPEFARNSAPVYDDNLNTEIDQSTQYMKRGGYVLPTFSDGGTYHNNLEQRKKIYQEWLNNSSQLFPINNNDFNTYFENPSTLQSLYADNPNYDDAVVDMMKREGMTNLGRRLYGNQPSYNKSQYLRGFKDNLFDWRTLDIQRKNFNSQDEFNKLGYNKIDPEGNVYYTGSNNSYFIPNYPLDYTRPSNNQTIVDFRGMSSVSPLSSINTPINNNQINNSINRLVPGTINNTNNSNPVQNKIGMTNWQMFNAINPLLQSLNVKTQYPYRQQLNPVNTDINYITPDAQLANINQDLSINRNLSKILNPQLGYANNSSLYGKGLDAKNQVIGQVNQQNNQLANQYNQNVANLYNQNQAQNNAFNKQYYDQLQTSLKNKNDYKQFLKNQSLSTFNQYLSENQALNNKFNMMNAGYMQNGQTPFNLVNNGVGYNVNFNPNWQGDILSLRTGMNANNQNNIIISQLQEILNDPTADIKDKNAAIKNWNDLLESSKKKYGGKVGSSKFNYRNLKFKS